MKKIIIGFICALLPIYSFVTWILVCNIPILKNQSERVTAYHETYFLGLAFNDIYLSIFNILLIVVAIYFISKAESYGGYALLKNLFLIILIFVGLINVWGLM